MDDPRLVQRQILILEHIKALSELLQGKVDSIDWELIVKLGGEIEATARTAQTLAIKQPKKEIQKVLK